MTWAISTRVVLGKGERTPVGRALRPRREAAAEAGWGMEAVAEGGPVEPVARRVDRPAAVGPPEPTPSRPTSARATRATGAFSRRARAFEPSPPTRATSTGSNTERATSLATTRTTGACYRARSIHKK